jgi:NADH dehydrogenase [ubiquinone] 1 alpha subcomplex assembly factor 5
VLDYGSGPGYLAKHMDQEITKKVVMVDSSRAFPLFSLPLVPY